MVVLLVSSNLSPLNRKDLGKLQNVPYGQGAGKRRRWGDEEMRG
jgi:hypothetical protein